MKRHLLTIVSNITRKVHPISGFKQEYQIEFWIRRRPVRNDNQLATDGHPWIIFSKCVICEYIFLLSKYDQAPFK